MAIEKRTICSQIEITESGTIQVRLLKQLVEDGRPLPGAEPHRLTLEPGLSLQETMAVVNGHLDKMGFPELASHEIARVARYVDLEHRPEIVQAHAAFKAERAKFDEAHRRALEVAKGRDEQAAKVAIEDVKSAAEAAEDAYRTLTAMVRGDRPAGARRIA